MHDIFKGFKSVNHDRVNRTLDNLQTVVYKLLLLLQQLDQVFAESKRNSYLLLQLLKYFSKYWNDKTFDIQVEFLESNSETDNESMENEYEENKDNVNGQQLVNDAIDEESQKNPSLDDSTKVDKSLSNEKPFNSSSLNQGG